MAEITEKIKDYMSTTHVNQPALLDKLSEFLAVEKGGKLLYQAAMSLVHDPDVLRQFQKFYEQTVRHEEILTRVISQLGGSPAHVSEGAKLAEAKAHALLETMNRTDGMRPAQVELNAMENIVLAETKDHADWELLGKIARQSSDDRIRDVLKPVVSDVEAEEDEHLNWTKTKMAELSMVALSK
jgi:rubrerythrin